MLRHLRTTIVCTLLCAGVGASAGAQSTGPQTGASQDAGQQQWEMRIGQQQYQQMLARGDIISTSPYYNVLAPIASQIKRSADRLYFTPFTFYLVKGNQPNAFSVPGGHVYVTEAMMTFAKSREELAGVLCHETAHDIHHDVYDLAQKDQRLGVAAGLLDALLGRNSDLMQGLIGIGANMQSSTFSRTVESNADHTGAYICAQSGINPWGMVWLFHRFENKPGNVPLEALSDHPRDDHRVSDLIDLFHSDPATFGRFSPNPATATPLK